jgi:hypothetical protein
MMLLVQEIANEPYFNLNNHLGEDKWIHNHQIWAR